MKIMSQRSLPAGFFGGVESALMRGSGTVCSGIGDHFVFHGWGMVDLFLMGFGFCVGAGSR